MWRRDSSYVGLRGRTEPNHSRGSANLYGTGAEIVPIDDWQRKELWQTPPPAQARYAIYAWVKRGHQTKEREMDGFVETVEEGKRRCDEWLAANTKE